MARAENAPNQFVTTGETTFAYRSFGAGSPVIFLNRFRATMDHWDPALVNAVAVKHRVIVFDNAGVSLSTGDTGHVRGHGRRCGTLHARARHRPG